MRQRAQTVDWNIFSAQRDFRFSAKYAHTPVRIICEAALFGWPSSGFGAAFPGWLQLKVIKTNNIAKVRNDAVDIVDFLPECGDQVINLPVYPSSIAGGVSRMGVSRIKTLTHSNT